MELLSSHWYHTHRRAPCASKLGIAPVPIMYTPLDHVAHQGGPVAATVLCVQRVHPLLFFESTAEGPVFRSQRAQHEHQRQQSQALQEVRSASLI